MTCIRFRTVLAQKQCDTLQDERWLLSVGNMTTSFENEGLRRTRSKGSNSIGVPARPILVTLTVQHQGWAAHRGQIMIERPIRKVRSKPRIDPCIQNPASLLTVVSLQPLELIRCLEFHFPGQ